MKAYVKKGIKITYQTKLENNHIILLYTITKYKCCLLENLKNSKLKKKININIQQENI